MAKVEVEILASGEVRVHVVGVAGPSCMKLTGALESELGQVEQTVKTADYYKVATATTATQRKTVTQ